MVNKIVVGIWLIVSIALQSFVAIADSSIDLEIAFNHNEQERVHQLEHHSALLDAVSAKHNIVDTKSTNVSEQKQLQQNQFQQEQLVQSTSLDTISHEHSDCHHCGHCSAPHVLWHLTDTITALNALDEDNFTIANLTLAGVIDTTYRPPIA